MTDTEADAGEPCEGWFRIGGSLEDFLLVDDDGDEEGYGPSSIVAWDERRGWYHVYYSDSQKARGDYAEDLPGAPLGVTARPEDVAVAVARLAGGTGEDGKPLRARLPWNLPKGYDEDPPPPEDEGWEVSGRLERSLTAYAGLQAPDPAAVRAVGEDTIISLSDYLVDDDLIRNGVWDRASQHDEQEMGPGEHWDYDAIEDGWIAECRYSLAAHGITWDRDAARSRCPPA